MKITLIIALIFIALALFYFFAPIKNSPMSGGPVSPTNPPRKLPKVSLYTYKKLSMALLRGRIVE